MREGKAFYDLGVMNEAIEEANGHIELRAIYNSRNDREENIIETSPTSSFAMETALLLYLVLINCKHIRKERQMIALQLYFIKKDMIHWIISSYANEDSTVVILSAW